MEFYGTRLREMKRIEYSISFVFDPTDARSDLRKGSIGGLCPSHLLYLIDPMFHSIASYFDCGF